MNESSGTLMLTTLVFWIALQTVSKCGLAPVVGISWPHVFNVVVKPGFGIAQDGNWARPQERRVAYGCTPLLVNLTWKVAVWMLPLVAGMSFRIRRCGTIMPSKYFEFPPCRIELIQWQLPNPVTVPVVSF